MTLRDFRVGWRLLVKEPAYAALVIMLLAVACSACFLLPSHVRQSVSYDRQVPERDAAHPSGQPFLATSIHIRAISIDVRIGFINGQ